MSNPARSHRRPEIPAPEELAKLSEDGGTQWNRLVFEQSPYLLQHAANPVDWYPWGDAAFEAARRADKPVFLSVGYSTCHWCHVMEHESFEDEEVAEVLNKYFIPIKVDREERPDIDQVYMTVTQAMTGQGGWPMTVIMTPDRKPFFAGTYFPKEGGYGRPGMMDLVPAIGEAWQKERAEILQSADQITEMIAPLGNGAPGEQPGEQAIGNAVQTFADSFDPLHGGFGQGRNKFPTPHNLSLLLRHHARTGDQNSFEMLEKTLREMRLGGIFDHVGFGFHRYSTDRMWLLPHFEKMLYDQAMLAIAYVEAWQFTGRDEFRDTAERIFEYVLRDMTAPEGGFYSAEDADSEGVEGKFYIWTLDEVKEVLGEEDGRLFAKVYNFEADGNFHEEATAQKTGENIPHLRRPLPKVAEQIGMKPEEMLSRLEDARRKLFAHREKREHPYKDDKVLTDWNGLMIAALAKGAKAFDEPKYAEAAAKAADFVLRELRRGDGRLLKRWRSGQAGLPADLEDYAFLVWGLIDLYEATFDIRWLREAVTLTEMMVTHFGDAERGGFFLTADDSEELIVRSKDAYDGAIPSGNAAAALNLARLALITGETRWRREAERTLEAFGDALKRAPHGNGQMLAALDLLLGPTTEIVLAGDALDPELAEMARVVRSRFLPRAVLLHRPAGEAAEIAQIAPFTEAQTPKDGRATAYVCRNHACEEPVTSAAALAEKLG